MFLIYSSEIYIVYCTLFGIHLDVKKPNSCYLYLEMVETVSEIWLS